MKGKKILSLSAALVLGLGVLAGFAGCDTAVTSAETRKKVFDAIAAADLTTYEMNATQSQESETKEKDSFEKNSMSATARLSYYLDDDKVFADYFTQSETSSESSSPSSESLEKRNSFQMNFYRGDSGYRFGGSWKGVGLKKGDYAGMVRKLKADDEYVLTNGVYSITDAVSDDTFVSFSALMQTLDGKITKTAGGYEAEVDVVNSVKLLLGKISGLVASYEKNSAMTVREFFADEFVRKLIDLTLQEAVPSEGFGALAEIIEEGTGRKISSNAEYYPAATNGAQAFYACLESKMLYTVLSQTAPSGVNTADLSSEDGTVGGMKASVLLGSAAEVREEIRKAAANPEKFLLEEMFGFKNGERDKGSLKMVTTVTLSRSFAVTGMISVIERSETEYRENEEDDGKIGTDYSKLSVVSETKVRLQKNSALTDLSGMKVDMGKRLKAGTYTLTAEGVTINGYDSRYNSVDWTGDVVCTATVTDTGVNVAAKFTSGSTVWNETRTYSNDSSSSLSDYSDLFRGSRTIDGTTYQIYGLSYYFSWYNYNDTGEMALGNYTNSLKIPTERVYITL